jgi:hypothetical protein
MTESPAQRALAAAAVALLVAAASIAMFLPPLGAQTTASVLRSVLFGIAAATGLLLHAVFLAIGARHLGRSVAGWTSLSVLLFPVGSVAALILLSWLREESERSASPA